MPERRTLESVREYYGKVLQSSQDLKTNACCIGDAVPAHVRTALGKVHPEVLERFYGCGSPIPLHIAGKTVLDLGCGSGRDTYVLSQLVGPAGRVIAVDMTDEQIAVARKHQDFHRQAFGHTRSNVEFHHGMIEDLEGLGIASQSVDVVISNCVINLSPEKPRVFREIFRVLKRGGELFFSDIFADRRIPGQLCQDAVLLGECLAGAMYFEDFRRLLATMSVHDQRVLSRSPVTIENREIEARIGMITFTSATVRAFNLDLEDRCEDYGQVAYYRGTVPEAPHAFVLDDHHTFPTGRPVPVCGNTAAMLKETRYGEHFRVDGDMTTHYGLFDCGPEGATSRPTANAAQAGGACC